MKGFGVTSLLVQLAHASQGDIEGFPLSLMICEPFDPAWYHPFVVVLFFFFFQIIIFRGHVANYFLWKGCIKFLFDIRAFWTNQCVFIVLDEILVARYLWMFFFFRQIYFIGFSAYWYEMFLTHWIFMSGKAFLDFHSFWTILFHFDMVILCFVSARLA